LKKFQKNPNISGSSDIQKNFQNIRSCKNTDLDLYNLLDFFEMWFLIIPAGSQVYGDSPIEISKIKISDFPLLT